MAQRRAFFRVRIDRDFGPWFARDGLRGFADRAVAIRPRREIISGGTIPWVRWTMESAAVASICAGQSADLVKIGRRDPFNRLIWIIDVSARRPARIKPLPDPFVIFTSQRRPRACTCLARDHRTNARLGNLGTVEDVRTRPSPSSNLSNVEIGAGDRFNHFTVCDLALSHSNLCGRVAECETPRLRRIQMHATGLLPNSC